MAVTIVGNNTPTAGGVVYGDGTNYASTAAGTSGQFLQSAGSGAPIWATLSTATNITRTTKTSNYTLQASDKGNLVVATSGTFTFSFTAAATLGAGWCVYLQNSGSGEITLDPNGTETIDGLTSYIMYPYESRLVICDGTSFYSLVITSFYLTYTTTSTFTLPPGYSRIAGWLWGAGGGGGKSGSASFISGGGGGGACSPFMLPVSSISSTVTVTIGAGGTGSSASNSAATVGGNSTFGSYITSYGGGGGYGSSTADSKGGSGGGLLGAGNAGTSGATGAISGGLPYLIESGAVTNVVNIGVYGGGGFNSGASIQNPGGAWGGGSGGGGGQTASSNCIWGAAGGAGAPATDATNNAGTSVYGGAGGSARGTIDGVAGSAPGGGGGATRTGTKGGDGARGEARIWGVI